MGNLCSRKVEYAARDAYKAIIAHGLSEAKVCTRGGRADDAKSGIAHQVRECHSERSEESLRGSQCYGD